MDATVPTVSQPADNTANDATRAPEQIDPQSALISLMNQRTANPQDLALRDAEHAAFSRYLMSSLGPVLGPAVVATSVPAYSAVKGVAQAMGGMQDSTPASLREVHAGLTPLYQQLYTLLHMTGMFNRPDRAQGNFVTTGVRD